MWQVTSTVIYIACQSVNIYVASFFAFHHCELAIAWQKGMPAYQQVEDDALKPILFDKSEQISYHIVVVILSPAAIAEYI